MYTSSPSFIKSAKMLRMPFGMWQEHYISQRVKLDRQMFPKDR